jgi:hypothetical protein
MDRKTSSPKKEYVQASVKRHIPFLAGRPRRETPIDRDDVVNLEIALNTCKTVDELLMQL